MPESEGDRNPPPEESWSPGGNWTLGGKARARGASRSLGLARAACAARVVEAPAFIVLERLDATPGAASGRSTPRSQSAFIPAGQFAYDLRGQLRVT
eukprot:scaffold106223_cov26-Tisochrysis_lutea.AAC.4